MLIRVTEPESDWLYSSEDYVAGELVTHAQSCIWITGASELARALLSKVDSHSALAATVLGMSYDEFFARKDETKLKNTRQAAKPPNFGFPGGMSEYKLVIQQRRQGPDTPCPGGPMMVEDGDTLVPGYKGLRFCILMDGASRCGVKKVTTWGVGARARSIPPTCVHCLECASRLRELWRRQWPENATYFKFVSQCVDRGQTITRSALERWPHLRDVFAEWHQLEPGQIMQHVTGRVRNVNSENEEDSPFCAAANGFFQGLLADASKHAHRIAARECHDHTVRVSLQLFENSAVSKYAGGLSPLYGSRIPGFLHDELIGEHPRSIAHDCAMRISEIMADTLRHYCPDLAGAAKAEPTLMKRVMKAAVPWYERGRKKAADANDRLVPWYPGIDKAAA